MFKIHEDFTVVNNFSVYKYQIIIAFSCKHIFSRAPSSSMCDS